MFSALFSIPLPARALQPDLPDDQGAHRIRGLDHFIAGEENRVAGQAVLTLLSGQAPFYNPLVIRGPTGTGKSHLAHGIARAWKQSHPSAKVVTATADDFARLLHTRRDCEDSPICDSLSGLRFAKLIVLEDIDQLAERPNAQRALINTIDQVRRNGGQLVFTLRDATAINTTWPTSFLLALCGRLAAGLLVRLSPPGQESRRAILRQLAAARGIVLPDQACTLLANQIQSTVPELYGVLLRLELASQIDNTSIDHNRVRNYLDSLHESRLPTVDEITTLVANYFQLKKTMLKSRSRRKTIVTARDLSIYLAREMTGLSYKELGRYFGDRDHSTIMHGNQKIQQRMEIEPEIAIAANEIRTLLRLGI